MRTFSGKEVYGEESIRDIGGGIIFHWEETFCGTIDCGRVAAAVAYAYESQLTAMWKRRPPQAQNSRRIVVHGAKFFRGR